MLTKRCIKTSIVTALMFSMLLGGSASVFASEGEIQSQVSEKAQIRKIENESRIYRITTDKEENAAIAKDNNYGPVSIIDNPELFINTYNSGNYELIWSNPTETDDYYVNQYGVVKLYKVKENNPNYDYYVLEMTSNIIGRLQYINGEWKKSGISKYRWRINNEQTTDNNLHNSDWSPKGTTKTSDGQKITVSVNPTVGGVSMGSIGTDFTIWKDTLRAYGGNHFYDVEWEKGTGAIIYPDTVDLNAAVEVTVPNGEYASWNWMWYWTYDYWFN